MLSRRYLIDKAQTQPCFDLIRQNCLHHQTLKSERRASWELCSLTIKVNNYAALRTMIRNDYDGRLVDILDLQV
jgi:hypothetical protein